MSEELYVYYKFKNRKTNEFKDLYVKITDVEQYAGSKKKYFDVHSYKVCEKRLLNKEEFDKGKVLSSVLEK